MSNVKERFYELYLSKKQFSPKNFTVFDVFNKIKNERLGEICYKDYKEEFNVCSGSVGLLKDNKHKGYCRLYYTYRYSTYIDTYTYININTYIIIYIPYIPNIYVYT